MSLPGTKFRFPIVLPRASALGASAPYTPGVSPRPVSLTFVPLIALVAVLVVSVVTVSARADSPEAALYERARRFQESLAGRGGESVASFLDPLDRDAPGSLHLLDDDAEVFASADDARIDSITVEAGGRRGRTDHLLALPRRARAGGDAVVDRFVWLKGSDGRWYVDLTAENR